MTLDDLREMDFKKIIRNLHRDYMSDFYNAETSLKLWVEDGKPIKKLVIEQVRELCSKATKNETYISSMEKDLKEIGYIESESMKEVIQDECEFYRLKISRLKQLKFIIPLVKPLQQLYSKESK